MTFSDQELVQQCQHGDRRAFNELIRRYQHAVYGLCYHFVGDFSEAQDLAQETFVRVFLNLHQVQRVDRFPAWLRQIASNVCQKWLRRRRLRYQSNLAEEEAQQLVGEHTLSPEEEVIRNEIRSIVTHAIAVLPEEQRLAVTLYYIDGLSYGEMEAFLEVPQTTIKNRLYRARKRLKKELIKMVEKEYEAHHLPEEFPEQILQEVEIADLIMDDDVSVMDPEKLKLGTPQFTKPVQVPAEKTPAPLVVLRLKDKAQLRLPIYIDKLQVWSIASGMHGCKPPRPNTHDLLVCLLQEAGATVRQIVLSDLQERTYYATLVIDFNGTVKQIDCRPSDAIAIAVRLQQPILVAKKLADREEVWIVKEETAETVEEVTTKAEKE